MDPTTITADTFLELQCDSCKNCLSYFPIYMTNDQENICGRCSDKLQKKQAQNAVIYETLARFTNFPCRYKNEGCSGFFLPKDIPNHENTCDFRKIQCFTQKSTHCNWEGLCVSFFSHCQEEHPDVILTNGCFELDLSKSFQRDNLLEHKSHIFIVKQSFCITTMFLEIWISCIKSGKSAETLSYELSLKKKRLRINVEIITAPFIKKEALKIFLDCFRNEADFSSTNITGEITFEDDEEIAPAVVDKVDEVLLSSIMCQCRKLILPPVYIKQDKSSQIIKQILCCSHCKNNDKQPPIRSLHLERLLSKLNYPCHFAKDGCNFIAKPPLMKQHVEFCPYVTIKCPVSALCKWCGLGREVKTHILEKHKDKILNSSTISQKLSYSSSYVIEFFNHLFYLHFVRIYEPVDRFAWVMQPISPIQKQFMFQVEVIDRNNKGKSLISRQMCTFFTKGIIDLKEFTDCCFNRNQLRSFISDDMIMFKIDVFE